MPSTDDIKFDQSTGETNPADASKPSGSRREIGAESEVRGGPEAPEEGLDESGDRPDEGKC